MTVGVSRLTSVAEILLRFRWFPGGSIRSRPRRSGSHFWIGWRDHQEITSSKRHRSSGVSQRGVGGTPSGENSIINRFSSPTLAWVDRRVMFGAPETPARLGGSFTASSHCGCPRPCLTPILNCVWWTSCCQSRHWEVELHFHKGLAGAPGDAIAVSRDTATNPAVLDAFALAIIASGRALPIRVSQGMRPICPPQANMATQSTAQ